MNQKHKKTFVQYISELSCMKLGTGLEQDFERNIIKQDKNRFCLSPVPVFSNSVPVSSQVPYNLVLKRTVATFGLEEDNLL